MTALDWQIFVNGYEPALDAAGKELRRLQIIQRIWEHDHKIWKPEPDEIANRLGWLHCPESMPPQLEEIHAFVDDVRQAELTQVLLLGMGGSSLAPEVFQRVFGAKKGYLELSVLDSTDPGAVLAASRHLDLEKTLFLVSTKSGGTIETLSLFKYFYHLLAEQLGEAKAGEHFAAITDPDSRLEKLARTYRFRTIFLNDPNIGGRFSALSHFGMVPAALLGIDVEQLLERAKRMAQRCQLPYGAVGHNPGADLGLVIGELAALGRDKLTLVLSPKIAPFAAWIEQLIAESSGKEGLGILPVTNELPGPTDMYGDDRLFVIVQLAGDAVPEPELESLQRAHHPVLLIRLADTYDLGAEFFRWEFATAIACWRLGAATRGAPINPFDQPNVESAKEQARKMMEAYREQGALPQSEPAIREGEIAVQTSLQATTGVEALRLFLSPALSPERRPRPYIALQAFLDPRPEIETALQLLAHHFRDAFRLATTYGFGPRFLHSTGQLHKGDAGNGFFIQLTAAVPEDVPIPDSPTGEDSTLTFGVLKMAQAIGDRLALVEAGRPVIAFDLGSDISGGLAQIDTWIDAVQK